MGTIYWQLNDTWPVASWSSLDYGGRWKAMHYLVKRFFQPVAVAAIPSDDGKSIRFSLVNDTLAEVSADLAISILTMQGERKHLKNVQAMCAPDAACTAATLDMSEIPPGTLLAWHFTASNGMGGEGHYVNGTYKALELEPAGLSVIREFVEENGSIDIDVTAKGLALFVMIETDVDGKYSDNAFDLAAGESRRITFTPAKPLEEGKLPEFRFYDLHSCQSAD
jgi:beta-mannosidase